MIYRLRALFSSDSAEEKAFYTAMRTLTGYFPKNKQFFQLAFRRKAGNLSLREINAAYERLEFLGDAILGALMADFLYQKYPQGDEGYLTGMRSKLVSRQALNAIGKQLNLAEFVPHSRSGGRQNQPSSSLPGNTLEALIGALYLDRGLPSAREFVHRRLLDAFINFRRVENQVISYKSLLIEWAQRHKHSFSFDLLSSTGANHRMTFAMAFVIDGKVISEGVGPSKKKAEEEAARKGCKTLNIKVREPRRS